MIDAKTSNMETAEITTGGVLLNSLENAVATAELAVLTPTTTEDPYYLETSLARKLIYRNILNGYFRNAPYCVSDLVKLTSQSRQNIAIHLNELTDAGLIELAAGEDKRTKMILPTERLLSYWRQYCQNLVKLPMTAKVTAAVAAYQSYLATISN